MAHDDTVRRMIEGAIIRGLSHGGRPITAEDRDSALAPHRGYVDAAVAAVETVIRHERAAESARIRAAAHSAPGVDSEMLDEAIEHALDPRGWK